MKESIGGTQLFIIVISLILIFSGIMALTINHSNAFSIKDQIVTILEKNGGFDTSQELVGGSGYTPLEEIKDLLQETSYRQTGKCPTPDSENGYLEVGEYQRDGTKTSGNNLSSFCIVKMSGNKTGAGSDSGVAQVYYYKIIVFYHLDLPVIKNIFNFRAVGETKALYN